MSKRAHAPRFIRFAVLLGMLAMLLAGCHLDLGGTSTDMAADQTLKMAWASQLGVAGLDPALALETSLTQVTSLLFDGLVTIDRDERVEPWAASSWTVSPDGLAYTFTLRPNLSFSDSLPVKASDYAWSLDRALNTCGGSSVAYELAAIKGAVAFSGEVCANGEPRGSIKTLVGLSILPDDSTNMLKILLERPAGYFLASLATPAGFVLERSMPTRPDAVRSEVLLKTLASAPTGQGGSGMFYLASASTAAGSNGASLVLKRNPYWWGLQANKIPNFREVDIALADSPSPFDQFQFLIDPSLAFASSLPDRILALGPAELKNQAYYVSQPRADVEALVFNWKLAPFDDLNARKAFCLAVNRDRFNQQVYSGQNLPGWHLVPQGLPGYNTTLKGIDGAPTAGSVALARQYWQHYLSARGGQSPNIQFYAAETDSSEHAALHSLQLMWAQALAVGVQSFPAGVPPKSVQISRFNWNIDYPDPQDFLTLLYASGSAWNVQQASVPAADVLMRQADALADMSQRAVLYQQAEQQLIDNVVVCPLYQTMNHYALRTWVKGDFVEDARGIFPNDAWVSGYIATH
ncbi:MAG TPA: ABC transporter substrate-binding protein [Ktedonobacterales bacterium]|nr:ABC transporter substrate-binding protein [Ktedonobacterales bacterium]